MPAAAPVGLQQIADDAPVSAAAAAVSRRILAATDSITRSCELVAEHFLGSGGGEMVVVALTVTPPDEPGPWVTLGDRVSLGEWLVPGTPCRSAPAGDGPEGALSMPYVSRCARDVGIVALPDRDALPPEGAQDRDELEQCATAALLTCALQRGETMYGSLSLARSKAGPWPDQLLADFQLLVATLAARLADQHARQMLTDALKVGEQARASQQQFFATVGHELRTPVSTIMGYAELLADEAAQQSGGFAAGVARDAGHVLSAAEQLLAIVEDLLDTGRALGEENARVPVDVAAAVADVLHWHRVPAGTAGVTMSSSVDAGLEVLARPSGLRQVLTNLVGNAVVHNRRGGTVEVGAQPMVGEGGQRRVRITVRDTGPGLDAEQLRRIFEPFVRFAGPDVRGTGLGLPLARTVAERDGGFVGVESTPGQGSVFWVDLPAV